MDEFRINWQIVGLLMITGQGLLFSLVLLLQRRGNRKANLMLCLLVLLILWHHLDFIINTSFWYQVFPYLYTPHYISWFLFGPLLYLYIMYLLQPHYKVPKFIKLSFLPAAVAFANYFGLYTMDSSDKVMLIRQTVIRNESSLDTFFRPVISGSYIFSTQILMLAASLGLCSYALRKATLQTQKENPAQISQRLRWLYFVLASFALAAMFSNFFFRAIWISPFLSVENALYLYIAPFTFLLLILETAAFLMPEVYTGFSDSGFGRTGFGGKKYTSSNLSYQDATNIVDRIRCSMEQEKLYLDSELRIGVFSRRVGIPVNHVSQAINQKLNKNFTEFVNTYRVEEAKRILQRQADEKANLLELALNVGFNNKTSFLNAFKKNLKISPSGYKKSLSLQK